MTDQQKAPIDRWISAKGEFGPNEKIDAFVEDIKKVCLQHGLSISHEDSHGGFVIELFAQSNIEWLNAATDATQ